jgi:hypothetical protein
MVKPELVESEKDWSIVDLQESGNAIGLKPVSVIKGERLRAPLNVSHGNHRQ